MRLCTSAPIRHLTFDLYLPRLAASLLLFPNCGMPQTEETDVLSAILATVNGLLYSHHGKMYNKLRVEL
eukprot:superscaffoldBa00001302_g9986